MPRIYPGFVFLVALALFGHGTFGWTVAVVLFICFAIRYAKEEPKKSK
jgi:phosphatidylserine synthase